VISEYGKKLVQLMFRASRKHYQQATSQRDNPISGKIEERY